MEPRTKKVLVVGGSVAVLTAIFAWFATSSHAATGVTPGTQVPPPRRPPQPVPKIEPSNIDRPIEHKPPGTVPSNTERQAQPAGACGADGNFVSEADNSRMMDYLNSLDKPEDLRAAEAVIRKNGCYKVADYAESRAVDIEKSAAAKNFVGGTVEDVGQNLKDIFGS